MSNSNYQFTPTLDGLNNITGDTISCSTIDTIDANIQDDLTVGDSIQATGQINGGSLYTDGTLTALSITKIGNGALLAPGSIANRSFNVLSTEGGIKLARNNASSGPFLELDSVTTDWTTVNNRVFIGGNTPLDERFLIRFRLGAGDQDTFVTRRTGTQINNPLTVSGNTSLSADSDLIFTSGLGKIVQTLGTSTNQMNAITLNNGQDLRLQTSGRLLQETSGGGINSLKATTFHADANITQSGTGIISQSGTGTNALKKTDVITALGQGTTASLGILDGTKNINFIPNITGGSFSGINSAGDSCILGVTSGTQNASALTLTTWNNNNVGIRINGATSVIERAGSNINTLSSTAFTTNAITNITNTTVSTGTTDGALVVSGGVGVAGNLNVGGTLSAGSFNPSSITTAGNITITGSLSTFSQSNISLNQNNDFSKTTISTNYASQVIANTLRIRDTGVTGKQFSFNPNVAVNNINPITEGGDSVLSSGTQSSDNAVLTLTTFSSTESGVRIAPTNTQVFNGIMNWSDGTIQYGEQNVAPMNIVRDINFFLGRTDLKVATFDLSNVGVSSSTQAQNLVQMGIVRITKGETYSGVWFFASGAGITFRAALYNTGASAARLAQRVTTNYTSVAGWNVCPFDSAYLNNDATKNVCIMLVPTNTTHTTYIYNNGNTNWGRGASAGNINLLGSNYSGFTGTFPANFTATPATASKYFLGLY